MSEYPWCTGTQYTLTQSELPAESLILCTCYKLPAAVEVRGVVEFETNVSFIFNDPACFNSRKCLNEILKLAGKKVKGKQRTARSYDTISLLKV